MPTKTRAQKRRIFLLSPANLAGRRAEILLREEAAFDLAVRVRSAGAPLGEIFSFVSGLYFRGKLAYATAFSQADLAQGSIFVITATRGLMSPYASIGRNDLSDMASVPIRCGDARYRVPLERDLARLARQIGRSAEVVLLGSIATPKYLEPLSKIFGKRLLVPTEFVGLGDMSRGALLLRAVRDRVPLSYAPAVSLARGGTAAV